LKLIWGFVLHEKLIEAPRVPSGYLFMLAAKAKDNYCLGAEIFVFGINGFI